MDKRRIPKLFQPPTNNGKKHEVISAMSLLTTSKAAARLVSRRCATNNGVASERSITLKNGLIGAVRNKQTAGPGIPSGVLSGWYNV